MESFLTNRAWLEVKPLPKMDPSDHGSRYVNSSPITGRPDAIVLHYTAGGHYLRSSWTWFSMPEAQASAHFIVGRHGEVVQCLPIDVRAWHAGNSEMLDAQTHQVVRNVNAFSIGIEIANFGCVEKVGDEYYLERGASMKKYKLGGYPTPLPAVLKFPNGLEVNTYWEPYSDVQIDAVIRLCQELVCMGIPASRIVGHQDICIPTGRKTDPGPLWPWDRLGAALGTRFPSRKAR